MATEEFEGYFHQSGGHDDTSGVVVARRGSDGRFVTSDTGSTISRQVDDDSNKCSSTKKEGLSDAQLRAFRQRLDKFDSNMVNSNFLTCFHQTTINETLFMYLLHFLQVVWLPYGTVPASDVPRTVFTGWLRYQDVIEPYMPNRVLRQFGYVQTFPMPINCLDFAYRPADSKLYKVKWNVSSVENAWTLYPRDFWLILAEFQRAQHSSDVADGYYDWFTDVSHIFVVPAADAVFPAIPDRTLHYKHY
ncbi:uncharacterized protein LOC110687784 [Chenopodium quinoa]|uniref:uncharacterized protein LOC110687784 n=1 Tax=Chenopodium quinoa TaxID=63459 RepID=UPI000B7890E4|nr:uncharacterized protein LOC110687784 [Chenopodium quinoa]